MHRITMRRALGFHYVSCLITKKALDYWQNHNGGSRSKTWNTEFSIPCRKYLAALFTYYCRLRQNVKHSNRAFDSFMDHIIERNSPGFYYCKLVE